MNSYSPKSADRPSRLSAGLAYGIVALATFVLGALVFRRVQTFHNETFDLAFYARIAWGMSRGDYYEPMLDTSVRGLHLAWVLIPLGWIGRVVGTVPTLLVAQTLAFGATGGLLVRAARRKVGPWAGVVFALAWCAYPNLAHVFTFEFHPGNLALPFFVWALDAIDRERVKPAIAAMTLALLCREDLALVLVPLACLGAYAARGDRKTLGAYGVAAAGFVAYFSYFLFVLQPAHAPRNGSLALHFGPWGSSAGEMLRFVVTHPGAVAEHLASGHRYAYPLAIVVPLAVLPALLGGRWLLPVLPIVAVNLLSHFPGTAGIESHYLTPAVPFLVFAAIEGLSRLGFSPMWWAPVVISSLGATVWFGAYPFSIPFEKSRFIRDARADAASAIVRAIPPRATVQVPYALLPHVAERPIVRRAPPPDLATDVVVLDAWHRTRYLHDEHLIRTIEEPVTRDWLAKPRRKLARAEGDFLMFVRGNPREGIGARRALVGRAEPESGETLTRCLGLLGSRLDGRELVLDFVAREACASDLAMRLGTGDRPVRVDLLFGGLFSPAHFERGDKLSSRHAMTAAEIADYRAGAFRIGLIRQSGARPDEWDRNSVPLTP